MYVTLVIVLILAYLIGSIPFGLIIGKTGYNIDIREHGSGNLGGTNTFRVLGIKAGMIVTISDILKGTAAVILASYFLPEQYRLIVGVAAVIGHMYPIFAKFKGGKAVATSGGIILGISPLIFAIMVGTFFLALYLSKYVSLSSMITGVVSVVVAALLGELSLTILISILTVIVIYRHRANIKRIKDKTEPKIKWM